MSAQASQAGHIQPPERSPAAIRAELPGDLRAAFDAEYQAALEDAKTTYRLDRVNAVIQEWWQTAWARRSPRRDEALEIGHRLLRGEPVETHPWPPPGWAEALAEPDS
jgi:hypothetical protein